MSALSLPEEFVLLLHRPQGSYYACDYTGAAELGELVLSDRVRLENKKVSLLTTDPSGVEWIDLATDWLQHKGGPEGEAVGATAFIASRQGTRKRHVEALIERGYLRREHVKVLFVAHKKDTPDPDARDRLVTRVREAARGTVELDDRLALLCALVHATGLVSKLELDRDERKRLKEISNGEQLGTAVRDVIAQTTAAITAMTVAASTAGGATGS